jgi:hypothetical protein
MEHWTVQEWSVAMGLLITLNSITATQRVFQLASYLTCSFGSGGFLWGYLKAKMYKTHPASISNWKHEKQQCVEAIPKNFLQHETSSAISNDRVQRWRGRSTEKCYKSSNPLRFPECEEMQEGALVEAKYTNAWRGYFGGATAQICRLVVEVSRSHTIRQLDTHT